MGTRPSETTVGTVRSFAVGWAPSARRSARTVSTGQSVQFLNWAICPVQLETGFQSGAGRVDRLTTTAEVELGRRNLTRDQFTLLIGRVYNRRKQAVGGQVPGSVGQNDPPSDRTSTEIATQHGVSEKTVRRAGKFAEEVEADEDMKKAVRSLRRPLRVGRPIGGPEPDEEKGREHQNAGGAAESVGGVHKAPRPEILPHKGAWHSAITAGDEQPRCRGVGDRRRQHAEDEYGPTDVHASNSPASSTSSAARARARVASADSQPGGGVRYEDDSGSRRARRIDASERSSAAAISERVTQRVTSSDASLKVMDTPPLTRREFGYYDVSTHGEKQAGPGNRGKRSSLNRLDLHGPEAALQRCPACGLRASFPGGSMRSNEVPRQDRGNRPETGTVGRQVSPNDSHDPGRIHELNLLERLRALHVVLAAAQDTLESETPGFDELGGFCILMRRPGDPEAVLPAETRALLRTTAVRMAHEVATATGPVFVDIADEVPRHQRLTAALHAAASAYPALVGIMTGQMDDDEDPDLQGLLFRVSQSVRWAYGELLELVASAKGVDDAAA